MIARLRGALVALLGLRGALVALLGLLAGAPAVAADLPDPWVQFTDDGRLEVRAITAAGAPCPSVRAGTTRVPGIVRSQPDAPDGAYPIQVCATRITHAAGPVTVSGLPVPSLPAAIRRVVVIGDTGCRLKGKDIQDCNDPAAWPFATIARLAAARRPDLVIHVGDYHYRESPCPEGRPGCTGSPYGDTWAVWQRDFFTPAAPLLAAAPWVMARGNHELCSRGGQGWVRLLDPHLLPAVCADTTAPYALRIGPLHLLMLDSAAADDVKPDPLLVPLYRDQLRSLFAQARPNSWLVTHRPVWAFAQGADVPRDAVSNATLQAAVREPVPAAIDLILSGHIHSFLSYDFGPRRPAQVVVGESGDANDAIVNPTGPGARIDGVPVRHGFALSDYGYVVLQRTQAGWDATVHSVTDSVLARCRMQGRAVVCHPAAR